MSPLTRVMLGTALFYKPPLSFALQLGGSRAVEESACRWRKASRLCPGKRPAGARKVSWGQGQLVARHRSCGQVHGCLRRRRGMGSCGLWRVPVCKVVPRGDHVRPLLKRSEGGRRSRRQAQARGRRRRPRTARCPIANMLPVGCANAPCGRSGRVFAAAAFPNIFSDSEQVS